MPSGYLISVAVPELGPGPWWEYVAIVESRRDAFDQAIRLADEAGTRAWLRVGASYTPLN